MVRVLSMWKTLSVKAGTLSKRQGCFDKAFLPIPRSRLKRR